MNATIKKLGLDSCNFLLRGRGITKTQRAWIHIRRRQILLARQIAALKVAERIQNNPQVKLN